MHEYVCAMLKDRYKNEKIIMILKELNVTMHTQNYECLLKKTLLVLQITLTLIMKVKLMHYSVVVLTAYP